ncbi:MAG: phosphatase PAP2 family protein [Acidobacteria bacterium]|nr:phosphatase PAP2 family protein [Acidobacteriota bacterium]
MLRRSERLLIAYFIYCAGCSVLMNVRHGVRPVTLAVNALVVTGVLLLGWAESLRHRRLLSVLRDWYPLPLMLLAYREMGWFAPYSHNYKLEQGWIGWDRLLLNQWLLRDAIESAGPLFPALLEISYSLVYTIAPFSMSWLYWRRRTQRVDAFLTALLTGVLVAYALFPFFPSEPPRTVFPDQDLPRVFTSFRRFNLALLSNYGIHLSVFPSAHVSGAFSAAFAMRELLPEEPWVWRMLAVLASSIATATIYGRYHYAVDAVAGFGISLIAWLVARHGDPDGHRRRSACR